MDKPIWINLVHVLDIKQGRLATQLSISCYQHHEIMPVPLSLTEMVFFTQLARLATREHIIPIKVELPELPSNLDAYQDYFGCSIEQADEVSIYFSADDA